VLKTGGTEGKKKTLKKSIWFVPMALAQREDCRIAAG
jgi:hypothetical protein